MKKILTLFFTLVALSCGAQDFNKDLASARTSYSSGDLSNARFAMEQMISDLDVAIGKQILAMLPTTMGSMPSNAKQDNVSGGSGAASGLYVHRIYAKDSKNASLDIINNSPLITGLNAIINTPLVGAMMRTENQKVIKVQGYKSILTRNDNGDKISYQLQIVFNSTLLTFAINDTSESEITDLAGTLPLAKIAQATQ